LGHVFSEVVMGMSFAEETNATYLYNDRIWDNEGKHGSYKWMTGFLPLQETELTKNDSTHRNQQRGVKIDSKTWAQWVEDSKQKPPWCNIEMRTKLTNCCGNPLGSKLCWCATDTARIGTFDAMKGRLRKAFSKSKDSLSNQLNVTKLLGHSQKPKEPFSLVVWHLRVGDLVLNARREYFVTIATQMASVFQNSSLVPLIVFIGEGGEPSIVKSFPFLPDICDDFFSSNCFYPELGVRDSLYHMIHSDILVTSGSSFSAVAGMLRSSGMTLAARAKEGVVGIYETSEQIHINKDGSIPMIDGLQKYLDQRSKQ